MSFEQHTELQLLEALENEPETTQAFLNRYVYGIENHEAYLEKLGEKRNRFRNSRNGGSMSSSAKLPGLILTFSTNLAASKAMEGLK